MSSRLTRQDFLRLMSAGAAGMAMGHAMSAASVETPAAQSGPRASVASGQRPNIVLIMADDMGFSDIGCYGSEIGTPNINSLADGGLRFTQFYNTARCCPTRASLLTGLYAHQAGVGHMANAIDPEYSGRLNNRCVTIAEALRRGGYRTMMVGKWHIGDTNNGVVPWTRGFEHYFGHLGGAGSYYGTVDYYLDGQPYTDPAPDFYKTTAYGERAAGFIEQYGQGPDPFFLYLAFTAPHYPLHAPEADVQRYVGTYLNGWDQLRLDRHQRQKDLGVVNPAWPLTPRDASAPAWDTLTTDEQTARDRRMAVYAAQIDLMDQAIGRVVAKIRQIGAEENTLIFFLADNGGCAENVDNSNPPDALPGTPESWVSYQLPWANASNTPFRLYKHWVHEGGISTPLIAYWPRVITTGGQLTTQYGHLIDIMPTCLDVAGVAYPSIIGDRGIIPFEGHSLAPILEGQTRPDAPYFWEHEGNKAVRSGKWKLVSKFDSTAYRPGAWELYDLEADRTEMNDLSASNPAKVLELLALYNAWAERAGAAPWVIIGREVNTVNASGRVRFVRQDVSGGDGKTWATAWNINEAAAAAGNYAIWVAAGTHTLSTNPLTPKSGQVWIGGFPPTGNPKWANRDPDQYETILDASGGLDHAVKLSNVQYVMIDGFTLSGALANGTGDDSSGGGVLCYGSGSNTCAWNYIQHCKIVNNHATVDGGGVWVDAPGEIAVTLKRCVIGGNVADGTGGAALVKTAGSRVRMIDCIVANNQALHSSGLRAQDGAALTVANCTLSGNGSTDLADPQGAGVTFDGGAANSHLVNTILEGGAGGAALCLINCAGAEPAAISHNLFHNNAAVFAIDAAQYALADLNAQLYAAANIDGDPAFVNKAGGDFHIMAGSAALETGALADVVPYLDMEEASRPFDENGDLVASFDIGAYEFQTNTHRVSAACCPEWMKY